MVDFNVQLIKDILNMWAKINDEGLTIGVESLAGFFFFILKPSFWQDLWLYAFIFVLCFLIERTF